MPKQGSLSKFFAKGVVGVKGGKNTGEPLNVRVTFETRSDNVNLNPEQVIVAKINGRNHNLTSTLRGRL